MSLLLPDTSAALWSQRCSDEVSSPPKVKKKILSELGEGYAPPSKNIFFMIASSLCHTIVFNKPSSRVWCKILIDK